MRTLGRRAATGATAVALALAATGSSLAAVRSTRYEGGMASGLVAPAPRARGGAATAGAGPEEGSGDTLAPAADGAFVPAVLCGVAMLVRDFVFWSVMRVEGFPHGYALAHFHTALWRAALSALVAFLWLVVRGRLVTDKTTIERYA